ncbi:maltose ABC transporter substrate-binding protein [Caloranaerobacter ferrireducens]|uniref:maltose ABC transporter substrate-binding protein n=1 Tax=Caloranaerobacter ferrireducens TaxID=1323370 RepID=UPI00084DB6E3|nr:maltose ABC transporter substrate-binding protein [Caloranaerobacter ferrireducens]
MKKFLSFLLIAVLVFSLVGCGAKEEPVQNNNQNETSQENSSKELTPEPGAKLVVWDSPGVEQEFMKEIAAKFTEKYGVPVTVEEVDHTKAKERLLQDGPAGIGADVFGAPHDHTGELVMAGLVLPNAFADRINKEMLKSAVDAVSFDGVVYGYPRAIETYALYYNKDIFPEPPKSYNEIIEFGKKFTNVNENKYALMWDVDNAYFSQAFLAGGGGYVFGNGGTNKNDVGIDSEGAIKGVKEMMKLKEILPIPAGDADYQPMMGLFKEGKIGAIINGPWALAEIRESGINYGIAKLPKLTDGSKSVPFSGVRALFVSAYTKYPNAAQLFANFYTTEENLIRRYEVTGQIPTTKAAANSDIIKNDPDAAAFLAQAADAIPMPSIPQIGLFWEPMGAAYGAIWNEEVSVEEGLKNAAETIRNAIAEQE